MFAAALQPVVGMSLPLFYASGNLIDRKNRRVTLKGPDAVHLARSLRAGEGDRVLVGDGEGAVHEVILTSVGAGSIGGSIESWYRKEAETPLIFLLQAVARTPKMDEVVNRAAEAGISSVVPFVSPRTHAASLEKASARVGRWRRIALEASKVARRAWPLTIGDPVAWPLDGELLAQREVNILLWEDETSRGLGEALPEVVPQSIGIIVGPEGGFAPEEALKLMSLGAVSAGIGDLVLRTETAGSYGAMVVRYHYGLLAARGE